MSCFRRTATYASHRGAMSTLQSVPVQFSAPFPLVQTVLFPLGFVKQGNWQSSITKAHRLEKSHLQKDMNFLKSYKRPLTLPPPYFWTNQMESHAAPWCYKRIGYGMEWYLCGVMYRAPYGLQYQIYCRFFRTR